MIRANHYRSGDIARRAVDEYFIYVDRADHVFKVCAYRVSFVMARAGSELVPS